MIPQWHDVLQVIVSLITGFLAGWYGSRIVNKYDKFDIDVEKTVALVVVCIWAFSMLTNMFSGNYETPIAAHGIMAGVVGYYFKKKDEYNKPL